MFSPQAPHLSAPQIGSAAGLLVDARLHRRALGELPSECRPANLIDAQNIVDEVHRQLSHPVKGWKLYFPYKAMQRPLVSPIYDIFESNAVLDGGTPLRRIEPEIVFRALIDLPYRARPYSYDEARGALVAAPSFEVLRSSYLAEPLASRHKSGIGRDFKMEIFADHNSNDCYVVGGACESWKDIDFSALPVSMFEDDKVLGASVGGHPILDPFLATFAGLNFLRLRGGLTAGQYLATSSETSFFDVAAGTTITGKFGPLGSIRASFAA